MEGGVTVILTLFLLVGGGVAGAVALFGAGSYVQRRKEKGELGGVDGARPEHTAVEDDSDDVLVPERTTKDTQGPD